MFCLAPHSHFMSVRLFSLYFESCLLRGQLIMVYHLILWVTPPDLPGRQRVGPHIIEDYTPELTNHVEDMIQNKGRKDARTENANVVRDRTFNRPVERHTHRYPTRNLIHQYKQW